MRTPADRTVVVLLLAITFFCGCRPTPKKLAEKLIVAVSNKDAEQAKRLLEAGADPAMPVENGQSALGAVIAQVNQSNAAGQLAIDASDKEEQILFLVMANLRRRRPSLSLEGPMSITGEYGGISSGGVRLIVDVLIRDKGGDHVVLLSSFETSTKNINRSQLDQVAGRFPILLGGRYRVSCTQYGNEGCEVDFIEHLDNDSRSTMPVPVGAYLPSTAHVLNAALKKQSH